MQKFFLVVLLLVGSVLSHGTFGEEELSEHYLLPINLEEISNETLRALAKDTYAKVIPCIEGAKSRFKGEKRDWAFPEDAYEHYKDILEKTAKYRKTPVHEYAGYEGPWIENRFIHHFSKLPLSSFRGFIPIFMQFIDTEIREGLRNMNAVLNDVLRPNVLYLAVSQGDAGLGMIGNNHPNILVLSAGGYGHISIPLIKGELPVAPLPEKFEQDMGFFGVANRHASTRGEVLKKVADTASQLNLTYKEGQGDSWVHDMQVTKFNLAPRGYGRSSFRFAE
jgi:hypothetical protein